MDASPGWAAALREGRWADFPGLPPDLAEDALLELVNRSKAIMARHPVMLGNESRVMADTEGFRYWLDHDGYVVLVEVENPPSAVPVRQALAALGAPDREDLGRHRRYGAVSTEYVYAGRGLGVTVAESYDDPPTFEPFLISAQLFEPTDLQGFVDHLGGDDPGGLQHRFHYGQ